MEKEQNRDRMADARQQVEQGREHVRQASEALEKGRWARPDRGYGPAGNSTTSANDLRKRRPTSSPRN